MRNLNKGVKSDYSIFPTPNKVMTSLKSSSKFFCKLDLLQGYYQIPISSKSRNLFCFALEDGPTDIAVHLWDTKAHPTISTESSKRFLKTLVIQESQFTIHNKRGKICLVLRQGSCFL